MSLPYPTGGKEIAVIRLDLDQECSSAFGGAAFFCLEDLPLPASFTVFMCPAENIESEYGRSNSLSAIWPESCQIVGSSVIMNKSPNKNSASEPTHQSLSQETIKSLQELGEVYRQIHRRLISEGYIIQNGKISKPESSNTNDGANG